MTMNIKTIVTFGGIALLAAGLQSVIAGDITGKVTLKGTPPPEKINTDIAEDVNCGKLHSEPVKTQFYVVSPDGGLADTVVMLKGITGKSTGASAPPLEIDQKGCEYTPYISVAQTGQTIIVKNSDPVLHNVHTTPTVAGNAEENKAQMPGGADLKFSFSAPENFIRFKCDVHRWMFCYVTVTDHPYATVSGTDGKFTIKNVPPGKYTIVAMHRKAAPDGVEKEIEVTADGAKVDFTLEVK